MASSAANANPHVRAPSALLSDAAPSSGKQGVRTRVGAWLNGSRDCPLNGPVRTDECSEETTTARLGHWSIRSIPVAPTWLSTSATEGQ